MDLKKQIIISFIFILCISSILIWGISYLKDQKEIKEKMDVDKKDLIDLRIAVIEDSQDALEIQINQVDDKIDAIKPNEEIDYDYIISSVLEDVKGYEATADCLEIEYQSDNITTFYCKNR